MSTKLLLNNLKIENMIYEIRGKQVMLDSDLASLYDVETRILNQNVKRNIKRFPQEFMFQLTLEEWKKISSQFVMTSRIKRPNKSLPFVFTEEGVAMLSGILKSDIAIKMSIKIINAFVRMRNFIENNLLEQQFINEQVIKNTKRIDLIEEALSSFKEKNTHIFFENQLYDAYSLLIDIFNKSKEEIIIIDNYIDKSILDILSKTNKNIKVITNKYNNNDYLKYKEQYNNVELIINNKIHDRFIIIDRKIMYHCGASFKDLSKKCFAINKIEDIEYLKLMLNKSL